MNRKKVGDFLLKNIVTILFITFSLVGVIFAKQTPLFLVNELVQRIGRNTFLVLALIIPVMAGLGLNFSIIIGAMAGQMALLIVADAEIGGFGGLLIAMVISLPLAWIFGKLTGMLLNKTKGQEMITSIIVGFFANGIYQFIYLFLAGNVFTYRPEMIVPNGVGVRNSINLDRVWNYSIQWLWDYKIWLIIAMLGLALIAFSYMKLKKTKEGISPKRYKALIGVGAVIAVFALLSQFTGIMPRSLDGRFKYALDGILRVKFYIGISIILVIAAAIATFKYLMSKGNTHININKRTTIIKIVIYIVLAVVFIVLHFASDAMPSKLRVLKNINIPVVTMLAIAMVALFDILITKTKIGQEFRAVGQSQSIATVSGIPVNKRRITAITISTILAAWGQIILLQNLGVLNTYGSHMQIGLYSVAALLVGGATVNRATVGQAVLGVILFHTLFVVAPYAGKNIFGDAQIGEYFRSFVAFGVIALSLGLYEWKNALERARKVKLEVE